MAGETQAAKPATAGDLLKTTKRQEELTIPGANILTPRQQMLDASDVAKKHPELHLRWVNIRDPNKASARKLQGYSTEPLGSDSRRLGDEMVLMAVPKALAEQRRQQYKKLADDRLAENRNEFEAAVEAMARHLRDNHGLKSADIDRILVNPNLR